MKDGASSRVVFIDQARAAAVALMLVGHSLDRFLGEPWRSGDAYRSYQFARGISSSLFLFVAGFSFVVASFRHLDDYLRPSARLFARLRRIAYILFLGYLLQLSASTFAESLCTYGAWEVEHLLRFDVLQNIGLGLFLLHATLFACRTPERFAAAAAALLAIIVASAAVTYRPEVDAALPPALQGMLNLYHQSRFPVVPYTAFTLLGALVGFAYARRRRTGDEWKVFAAASGIALLLIGFELVIRGAVPGVVFPYGARRPAMPGNTFARAGCALLAVSGLYLLGRWRLVLPRLSFVLSKDSLAIYFTHLLIVYGSANFDGLCASYQTAMDPIRIAIWIAALSLAMGLLALGINRLRERRPAWLRLARHIMILGVLAAFFTWTRLTPGRIALTAVLSAAAVLAAERAFAARGPGPRAPFAA